jgi:hypothetical protein
VAVLFVLGKRTHDFAFVALCYGRSGEEIGTGYMPWPLAAECNMITNKQTRDSGAKRAHLTPYPHTIYPHYALTKLTFTPIHDKYLDHNTRLT